MEIRPQNDNGTFGNYANTLKDFREQLFRKSINWKFPVESFVSEFDPLVDFYTKIINQYSNLSKNSILFCQLIKPLSIFFFSLDIEFQTNYYFYKKIKNLKCHMLMAKIIDVNLSPVKRVKVRIFRFENLNIKSKSFVQSIKSDKEGNIKVSLPEAIYEIEIKKYGLHKVCDFNENKTQIIFQMSKKKHFWQ